MADPIQFDLTQSSGYSFNILAACGKRFHVNLPSNVTNASFSAYLGRQEINPPSGIFTYVCGLVMHKNAKNYDKALALIDSSISDQASDYMIKKIGDSPANAAALEKQPDSVFQALGIPRDVDNFLRSGTFERRLKNKDQIVNAWTEIRAGL